MVYARTVPVTAYVELAVTSNFSFLRGASHPEELVRTAALLGHGAAAIADRNSVAGVVRAHVAAKQAGIKLVVGARLVFADGFEAVCLPENRAAYGQLSQLLTTGNLRAPKGACDLRLADLRELSAGHIFIAMPPPDPTAEFSGTMEWLAGAFPARTYLGATRLYRGNDETHLENLADLSARLDIPLVATNDVHYHTPGRRPLQDILTCVRHHRTIFNAGFLLHANAERHLKEPGEMARLFRGHDDALTRTADIAARCHFSLDELAYEYPDEPSGQSATPQRELERLTWLGAKRRFPGGLPEKLKRTIKHELALIEEMTYAPYFLTVSDIVRYARSVGILCQGRGSAANSAVCYCLGITSVDPTRIDLLFERFVSAERDEPPDIDVDFEHERREEVIQYIYRKYGRHRAGLAATVITYRSRSAVREVGKAMGLSLDLLGTLSGAVRGRSFREFNADQLRELGLDPTDPTLTQTLKLVRQLMGFPRHLSQHVGGFVITRGPLDSVIPIANAAMPDRTFIEWDKNDLDALGILKIDVLSLGMLTCIRKAFGLIERHYGTSYDLATVPREDARVYDMICRADTVGVFQIESRAQMSMLPRLRPRTFYDLVIEVALVRPGPIQGDMVHPYLKRRQGLEKVDFPSEALRDVLGKTLGIPLFQEQAMKIAIVAAGFSPGEADQLRRAMATFKRTGQIGDFRERFINGMLSNGYALDFAEKCFRQIEGFSDYGFPESHAASFALLSYVSSWLKCFHPDAFACALLNSQPMGFYSASSIVRDLRDHGGIVLPVDINFSQWDHILEARKNSGTCALRLGFRQVKGVRKDDASALLDARADGFDSIRDLYFRAGISTRCMERLARADAFCSLGLDRRDALWAVQGLGAPTGIRDSLEDLPLYANAMAHGIEDLQREEEMSLPAMPLGEHVIEDYATLKLSLKAHPVSLLRNHLTARNFVAAADLACQTPGKLVSIAGLVLVRQRPGTASGVIFATLEDETGIANVIIWPKVFEANRKTVLAARFLSVKGILQIEQTVIHVIARDLTDLSDQLAHPGDLSDPGVGRTETARVAAVLPKGRNFQ